MTPPVPLFRDDFLLAQWADGLDGYAAGRDAGVRTTLAAWAGRDARLTEIQDEGGFVQRIVCDVWGHRTSGSGGDAGARYTATPKVRVAGAGQGGGTGEADLALGLFGDDDRPGAGVPQALCEFKDVRSGLDAPQNRKGNRRSPVRQCLDYLRHAFEATPMTSPAQPRWGVVTDMREFRLYARRAGRGRFQRFVLAPDDLLADGPVGVRRRYLFARLFSPAELLSDLGRPAALRLFEGQLREEEALEKGFYKEYTAFRRRLYDALRAENPDFPGTPGELVRLAQRLLDRFLFVCFCEDMGRTLGFPPRLLERTLAEQSAAASYSPDHHTVWPLVKELFRAMRAGGTFPPDHDISRFNGGLFADDPRLDALRVPNAVFCARGQGRDGKALERDKRTLLYLAAAYNFGATGAGGERTITLYTLGRIFEQSITELEYLHAEVEGRPTVAKLSKRKRNGVYYTPEWVTGYIVERVVGGRLAEERDRLGLEFGAEFKKVTTADGAFTKPVREHLRKLETYRDFLADLRVLDPACGSGAFLIQTLAFLRQHHRDVAAETERASGGATLFDEDAVVRGILAQNLYGVDLNPESVEITQLALWLHTAVKGQPLTTLDDTIRCGNSLVGGDYAAFHRNKHGGLWEDESPAERERIRAFDWAERFPEVCGENLPAADRGFDCVVGNPPYVKLQHVRAVRPDETDYLTGPDLSPGADGRPRYESTQTGNYDLYLPFIERGLTLLNARGRMGYIAPSVWLKNDYGEGLKRFVKRRGALAGWADFGGFQVFDDVTVYTALQFFRGGADPSAGPMRFHLAPDGNLTDLDPAAATAFAPAAADPAAGWNLVAAADRPVFDRMAAAGEPLGAPHWTEQIFQGLITSADWCYHLARRGPGRYERLDNRADGTVYEIEDAIMKPLVSGPDADRYLRPVVEKYLLFPYNIAADEPALFTAAAMAAKFPKAWDYLRLWEDELRGREGGKFDDKEWFRFGRNQGLETPHRPKLGVSQTVKHLRLFADPGGDYYFNNVRVNGVLPARPDELWFLLGVLNSGPADWYFRRIARPKANGYFEANKQFIAPVPVPEASPADRRTLADAARRLQDLHTRRRDAAGRFAARSASGGCVDAPEPPDWLWADTAKAAVKRDAPAGLRGRALTQWAKAERVRRLAARHEPLDALLAPGRRVTAAADGDALTLSVLGEPVLTRYGLDPADAALRAALWRGTLRDTSITPSLTGERLVGKLLAFRRPADDGLRSSLLALDAEIIELDAEIAAAEGTAEDLVARLYGLTAADRAHVAAT